MSSARQMTRRRSQLRWRLSYQLVGLGALWLCYSTAMTFTALSGNSLAGWVGKGQRFLMPFMPVVRQWVFWVMLGLILWMALSVWQLYRVGSKPAEKKKRCPECGGRLEHHTIRRGKAAGQAYWACEHFPRCAHTSRRSR